MQKKKKQNDLVVRAKKLDASVILKSRCDVLSWPKLDSAKDWSIVKREAAIVPRVETWERTTLKPGFSFSVKWLWYQIGRIKLSYRLNTHWKVRRCIRRYMGDGRQLLPFLRLVFSRSVRAVDPRWRYPPGIHGNYGEPSLTHITPLSTV